MAKTACAVMVLICSLLVLQVLAIIQTCNIKHNPDLDDKISESWVFQDLQLRNSSSKLACASQCLQEFSCVTFMVQETLRLCRLHAARIDKYSVLIDAPGFRSYDTCRSDKVFGDACKKNADCTMSNSACVNQTCQCDYGWIYSPNDLACVKDCIQYGTEFTYFRQSFLDLGIDLILKDPQYVSVSGCASACVSNTEFICRSFYLNFDDKSCTVLDDVPSSDLVGGLLSIKIDIYLRQCQYVG